MIAVTAVVISLFMGFLLLSGVSHHREVDRLNMAIMERDTTIVRYETEIGGLRNSVAESRLLITSSRDALENMVRYTDLLKKTNIKHVYAISELELKISALRDSLRLKWGKDTIYVREIITDDGPLNVVEVPLSFDWDDDYAYSWGSIDKSGLAESGFTIKELPLTITLGSRGWLRKQEISVVSTPNPYVTVEANQSILVKGKSITPALIGTGVIIGTVVTYLLMR